ncbi:MAG: hypothetical protein JWO69_396, partial [Thermoleophilia bacterium]|nr:hypothetical protein [Thermoleophilia bacterium]
GRAGSDTYTADHRGNYFICLDQRRTVCPAHDGRKGEKDRVGDDVENVVLTGDGWDIVAGSRAANIINTGPGRDVIVGSAGADDYQGGAAFDVITYEYVSIQPRRVHLTGDGRDNDGGPRRARIRESVEGLVGSVFGDVIIGSPRSDSLYGLAGNDRITGGGGRDLVDGGLGNDSIDVRDGRGGDEVRCGKGRDTVRADAGDRVAKDCERRS